VRRITVQGQPGSAERLGERRGFTQDLRPCTRYYPVALRDNRLDSDFRSGSTLSRSVAARRRRI